MKKLITSAAAVAAVLLGANVMAADTAPTTIIAGDTIGDTGAGQKYECSLLGDNVKVSLSQDVVAVFSCTEVTSAINIGTCHTAGQRADRNVDCVQTGVDASGNPVWNVDGCSAGASVNVDLSYTGYVASSTGGAVAPSPLAGNCDTDGAELKKLKIFN